MKIALPIAMVITGVLLIAILMSHRHWKPRNWDDRHADENEIAIAKQMWLDKVPDQQAEDSALNNEFRQAEKAERDAREAKEEARRRLADHDRKIQEELVKNDPTLQQFFDRLNFDKRVPFEWGDQQLAVENGGVFTEGGKRKFFEPCLVSVLFVFPLVTFVLGLFLLYRLPSIAGAHLFLCLTALPLICFGPILLHQGIDVYLIKYNTLGDMGGPAEIFLQIRAALWWTYLAYLPSLILYVVLLLRIRNRDLRQSSNR